MATKNKLLVHILDDNLNELGVGSTKKGNQEFTWRKRIWPIDATALAYTDKKENEHLFVNINKVDGTYRFISPKLLNQIVQAEDKYEIVDKCAQCGGRISIDAKNAYDLLKRKTINAIWGIDQSHIVLLIIMGIIAIAGLGGVFYLLGANTKLQEQLNKYLPTPDEIKQQKTNVKLIMEILPLV